MYTGIVQCIASVAAVTPCEGYTTIAIENRDGIFDSARVGASVAVDGTCLTLTARDEARAHFDVSDPTAGRTTLAFLQVGDEVNIERSHCMLDENGGHNLYGHTEGIAYVQTLTRIGRTTRLSVRVPPAAIGYFFPRGFVGLHGCSLTVDTVDDRANVFTINLIPETLRLSTFGSKGVGDALNYEIDATTRIIVDTIQRSLQRRQ